MHEGILGLTSIGKPARLGVLYGVIIEIKRCTAEADKQKSRCEIMEPKNRLSEPGTSGKRDSVIRNRSTFCRSGVWADSKILAVGYGSSMRTSSPSEQCCYLSNTQASTNSFDSWALCFEKRIELTNYRPYLKTKGSNSRQHGTTSIYQE